MTDAEFNSRVAKLKRRAPFITSRQHFERIIESFPEEHRQIAIDSVEGILRKNLKELPEVEVKVKDEANVAAAEATAIRIQQKDAKIIELSESLAVSDKHVQELEIELKAMKKLLDEKQK